ncbi:hypothetical protein NL676_021298 [Syzygium grande]|nr:hypothetical protein NL676_021298 [Syzygium grande]
MDEVESMFTKHFTNNDRKKAMKFLRPQQQRDSHMVTFFVGLFTGCFVTLFSLYAILAHLTGIFSSKAYPNYVDIVYPVFSAFPLFSLHLLMYGCNLFAWKQTRINCNFICEFSPTMALKYQDAFLICTTSMMTMVGMTVVHLFLRTNGFSSIQADPIPRILLLVYILLLVCPFNVFYCPTRYCFIRVIRNIICSPFCKVLMVDFFMADQLTSQVIYIHPQMKSSNDYELTSIVLAEILAFLVHTQCARRWLDEGDANHPANMGKYVSAMVAAGARLTYARREGMPWLIVVVALNTVLRFAWVEMVLRFRVGVVESLLLDLFLASLEVIRRGHWNFYRLENEHLNNVRKFEQ